MLDAVSKSPETLPFVPLVGQPLEVVGWTLMVVVLCKCERPKMVTLHVKQSDLGRTADMGICSSCGRTLHISALGMDAANQLEISVACGMSATPNAA